MANKAEEGWVTFLKQINILKMTDLKIEKSILMKFIDCVYAREISREEIEERVEMFAIVVADKQRECCALWVENSSVMDCPLATNDFYLKL